MSGTLLRDIFDQDLFDRCAIHRVSVRCWGSKFMALKLEEISGVADFTSAAALVVLHTFRRALYFMYFLPINPELTRTYPRLARQRVS